MTNGDRIREMASTDEGLAELVSKYVGCNHCPVSSDCENRQSVCEYTFKKWLNKEILKPCPFCGDKNAQEYKEDNLTWLECPECGGRTKMCRTLDEAEAMWNRRAGNAD